VSNCSLIVGSLAFDDLDLPSGSFRDVVGGSAAYASLAAGLFTDVRVVAVVGVDFPVSWLQQLRSRRVDVKGIDQANGATFRWHGRYAADLATRTTISTELNVFAQFSPDIQESYRDSSHVLLGNIHPALQLRVLDQVQNPRMVAADTMNYWISGERPTLLRLMSRIDVLLINDEEVRLLGEDHNIARAARRVRSLGPRCLIVKRGDAGAMLFDDDGTFFCPALPLDWEVDPTGAGDTFAGALIGQLAALGDNSSASMRRALQGAAAAASFCVQGVGTEQLMQATLAQVEARRDQISALALC
jgi:sugar/nucleoside kinase (ribokinase family)